MTVTMPGNRQTAHFGSVEGGTPEVLPLVALTDRGGNRIAVSHDADGVPAELTHAGGYRVGIDRAGARIGGFRLLSHPDRPVLVSYAYDAAEISPASPTPPAHR